MWRRRARRRPGFVLKAPGTLAAPPDETALQLWWRRFGDSKLDGLIAQTIASNHDVKAAVANIKAARSLQRVTRFDFAPIVTSEATYLNNRSSSSRTLPGQSRDFETFDASFDAAWELDLFGRVRRSVEAASADLAATEAQRDDLLVSVTTRDCAHLYGTKRPAKPIGGCAPEC